MAENSILPSNRRENLIFHFFLLLLTLFLLFVLSFAAPQMRKLDSSVLVASEFRCLLGLPHTLHLAGFQFSVILGDLYSPFYEYLHNLSISLHTLV